MTQSPLQEAITLLEAEIMRNKNRNSYEAGECRAYENAKDILESLLPKEKEFVQKIWEAAEACAADGENPDKFEFLNQLYPKS